MPSRHNEWRRMQIILPNRGDDNDVVTPLYSWHGGQNSYVYALASTGNQNLVSLSMIDAALDELRSTFRKMGKSKADRKDKKDLNNLIGDLSTVRIYWNEHDAKSAGLEKHDSGYDRADYGLDESEEAGMVKKGEWTNPRKAMRGLK